MNLQAISRGAALAAFAGIGAFALAGCSGPSFEGTYLGSAGDTVLVLKDDGSCRYSEDYETGDDLSEFEDAEDDGCRWTSSDETITIVRDGEASLTGTLSDDGSISLPDQDGWNAEIYSKED